jgi:hypothetical protein
VCFVSSLGCRRYCESLGRRGARRERWTRVVPRSSVAPQKLNLLAFESREWPGRPCSTDPTQIGVRDGRIFSSTRPPSVLQPFEIVLAFVDGLGQPLLHTYMGYEWLLPSDGRAARCLVIAAYSENLELAHSCVSDISNRGRPAFSSILRTSACTILRSRFGLSVCARYNIASSTAANSRRARRDARIDGSRW